MSLAEKIVSAWQNSETHHESFQEAVTSLTETDAQVAIYSKSLLFKGSAVTVPRHGDMVLGFRSHTACEPHLYAVKCSGQSEFKGSVKLEPGKFTVCYIPLMEHWHGMNMNYWSPQLVVGPHDANIEVGTKIDVVYALVKDNHGLHFGKYNLHGLPKLLESINDEPI